MKVKVLGYAVSAVALLALAACGQKTEAPAASAPAPAAAVASAPVASAPAAPVASAPASAAASAPASAAAPAAKADAKVGETVYNQTCQACHAAGLVGAPKLGDKADWGPRVAQGKDVLYKHAIEGYTGKKGVMVPKGGSTAPDADIKAAVDYMVEKAK